MTRIRSLVICCFLAAIGMACGLAGCRRGAATAPAKPRPSPEESFNLIVESFKRQIGAGAEGIAPELVTRGDSGGVTSISLNKTISHELIPPAADEPLRAKITLTTNSRVARMPAGSESKLKRESQSETTDETGEAESAILDTETEILDPGLVGKSTKTRSGRRPSRGAKSDAPLIRPVDEIVQTYEFVYRNDRWELITEIDPKRESIRLAIEQALKTQS